MKKIYLDDILVIESFRDYLKISTSSDRYIIHLTLSSFTEQLPQIILSGSIDRTLLL